MLVFLNKNLNFNISQYIRYENVSKISKSYKVSDSSSANFKISFKSIANLLEINRATYTRAVKLLYYNVFHSHNSSPITSLCFELNKVISKFNDTIRQTRLYTVQPFRRSLQRLLVTCNDKL